MPRFTIRLSDEITVQRTLIHEIEADTVEEACDKAIDLALTSGPEFFDGIKEEQVDATVWLAEPAYG